MMIVESLLSPDSSLRRFASQPEMDPLTEEDALQEGQLLDIRLDAGRSTVALLFDLRLALQLRDANTGVFVAHGVQALSWTALERPTRRTAWSVISSIPKILGRSLVLDLVTTPDSAVSIKAASAAFFVGHVPGLTRIPNYTEDDEETIQTQIPAWSSSFTPIHAVFLASAPG